LVGVLVAAAPARADEMPWVKGVSAERRSQAQTLLQAGNALLIERNYVGALAKYSEAIASWDHPAITGGVLLFLNRDRTVYETPSVNVAPANGGATVSFAGQF